MVTVKEIEIAEGSGGQDIFKWVVIFLVCYHTDKKFNLLGKDMVTIEVGAGTAIKRFLVQ